MLKYVSKYKTFITSSELNSGEWTIINYMSIIYALYEEIKKIIVLLTPIAPIILIFALLMSVSKIFIYIALFTFSLYILILVILRLSQKNVIFSTLKINPNSEIESIFFDNSNITVLFSELNYADVFYFKVNNKEYVALTQKALELLDKNDINEIINEYSQKNKDKDNLYYFIPILFSVNSYICKLLLKNKTTKINSFYDIFNPKSQFIINIFVFAAFLLTISGPAIFDKIYKNEYCNDEFHTMNYYSEKTSSKKEFNFPTGNNFLANFFSCINGLVCKQIIYYIIDVYPRKEM